MMVKATFAGILVLILVVGFGAWQFAGLSGEIRGFISTKRNEYMSTAVTKDVVNAATGLKADISTTRNDGETQAAWALRHIADINAWKNATP